MSVVIETGALNTSKHAILVENILSANSMTASSGASDAPISNAVDGATFDFWTPTAMPADFTSNPGVASSADCMGVVAHDLGSKGVTIDLDYWDGASWVDIFDVSPADNATLMVVFPEVSATQFRATFTGSAAFSIGHMALGKRLAVPSGIVGDYAPPNWSKRSETLGAVSNSGQFLNQRVVRRGAATSISLGRVARSWFEQDGLAFQEAYNDGSPFFFAGWPDTLADDVAFCRRPGGGGSMQAPIIEKDWVSLSFEVESYVTAD